MALVECIEDNLMKVQEEGFIQLAQAALDDTTPQVKDPVEKVNMGTTKEPMEEAFDRIKEHLSHPPVFRRPRPGIPLKLYISASTYSIPTLLAQDDTGEGVVVAQTDLVKYMLTRPILRGVALISQTGARHSYSFQLEWRCTNDQVEYETIIIGMKLLLEMGVTQVKVLGDSLLVINQLNVYKLNELAQVATVISLTDDVRERILKYLKNPTTHVDKKVRYFAINYLLKGDDLLRMGEDAVDLRMLGGGQGTTFMAKETTEFLRGYRIKFLHSTLYYAEENGQAEVSNNIILSILKRMLEENPREWHTELDNTLWAYRLSKRTPTCITPYALMFGHDVVLLVEIMVQSLRVREQQQLVGEDYVLAMYQEHEDLDSNFGVEDLVWKTLLPFGKRTEGRDKWSSKWEGPIFIDQIVCKGAYYLRDIDGEIHQNSINGRHLKKYFPSIWEFEDPPPIVENK
ncbi:uncharacterized protein LOC126792097 [Argentina anserina]|uniref:uncharacterized protein LOC126792097 n=1 Tax=Argentina anserina TaxID=57926 RepID=UPI0021765E44|nr:uncharacterized protein LOC126792097 [Potentilla anserina]